MSLKPLCFVVMPFGNKPDAGGRRDIDFDTIYLSAIKPGIEDAAMEPIRADEERTGGVIHTPMFERLLLCDFVLADLTAANANVFYELGVRHTARPATTLTIFAKQQPIPFDVNFLRSLPYDRGKNNVFGEKEIIGLRQAVTERLIDLKEQSLHQAPVDSPLFQLIADWKPGNIARLKTDVFREQVQLNEAYKQRLAVIRDTAKAEGKKKRRSKRLLPEVLKRQVLVREQLALAYNRRAGITKNPVDRDEALRILAAAEKQQGPSSETCGLIGRIYKDKFTQALAGSQTAIVARGHLNKSIDAYLRGFLADQRDAYPGINAVTLLNIRGDAPSLKKNKQLLPVVKVAVMQRLGNEPDYWDHATKVELAVLDDDQEAACEHLANAPITSSPNTRVTRLAAVMMTHAYGQAIRSTSRRLVSMARGKSLSRKCLRSNR